MDGKISKSYADIILETYTIAFWVENSNDKTITLFIEPWGQYFDILPGEFVQIVARGPKSGCPLFYCKNDDFTYCGWARSVYVVYKNQELMTSWSLDDCPPEPSPLPNEENAIANYEILSGM
jgi:hypothetical protein